MNLKKKIKNKNYKNFMFQTPWNNGINEHLRKLQTWIERRSYVHESDSMKALSVII